MRAAALLANSYYKRCYEDALWFYDTTGPAWEDLTDEQREAVRQEQIRYGRECDEMMRSLTSKGGEV